MFGQHRRMPDPEIRLALRQVDQLRTDIANPGMRPGIYDAAHQCAAERSRFVAGHHADRARRRGAWYRGDRGFLAVLSVQLDLTDEETLALLNLLTETIDNDRYPLSPRIRMLRGILAKFGPMGPAPPPPARPPTPEERDPRRAPRFRSGRRR
jgi:hypothetical protein